MMLGASPWWVVEEMGRPFAYYRAGALVIPSVLGTLRGIRNGELVNSEVQAEAFMVLDARPFTAAGIKYLMKFDRLISALGESYAVQQSRLSYDGTTVLFHKCYVQGGTV